MVDVIVVIAVIVTSNISTYERFLKKYSLPSQCFPVVVRAEQIVGYPKETPIIVVSTDEKLGSTEKFWMFSHLKDVIRERFVSIRGEILY